MCVCMYVSNTSTGTDGSSPPELRADSCWSDTVSTEEDISLPPLRKVSQLKQRAAFSTKTLSEAEQHSYNSSMWCVPSTAAGRTAKHEIFLCFKVSADRRTCFIFSYLACFQAIKLRYPRGQQTGSDRTSPGMNRAVSVTTGDLLPPTALAGKCEWRNCNHVDHGYIFL